MSPTEGQAFVLKSRFPYLSLWQFGRVSYIMYTLY